MTGFKPDHGTNGDALFCNAEINPARDDVESGSPATVRSKPAGAPSALPRSFLFVQRAGGADEAESLRQGGAALGFPGRGTIRGWPLRGVDASLRAAARRRRLRRAAGRARYHRWPER